MSNRRNQRPHSILAWRPVLLLGGGIFLAIFEAVQPLLGRSVEWAIVSLAATMMGLELFQGSREPMREGQDQADRAVRGNQEPAASPDNPGSPDNPAVQAVQAERVGRVFRKGLVVAAEVVARAVPVVRLLLA